MRKAMFFMGLWVVGLVLSALLFGCGRDKKEMRAGTNGGDRGTYTYEFIDRKNRCTTGRHTYYSRLRYCQALVSEGLNGNCARAKRLQTYDLGCR